MCGPHARRWERQRVHLHVGLRALGGSWHPGRLTSLFRAEQITGNYGSWAEEQHEV